MEKPPENFPEHSYEKEKQATQALADFIYVLMKVENQGWFVDLNRISKESSEIKGDFKITQRILQGDELREKKIAFEHLRESLPSSMKHLQGAIDGFLFTAALYLAAQDKKRELAEKNLVFVQPTREMSVEEMRQKMAELDLEPLALEDMTKYLGMSYDQVQKEIEALGFTLEPPK